MPAFNQRVRPPHMMGVPQIVFYPLFFSAIFVLLAVSELKNSVPIASVLGGVGLIFVAIGGYLFSKRGVLLLIQAYGQGRNDARSAGFLGVIKE